MRGLEGVLTLRLDLLAGVVRLVFGMIGFVMNGWVNAGVLCLLL